MPASLLRFPLSPAKGIAALLAYGCICAVSDPVSAQGQAIMVVSPGVLTSLDRTFAQAKSGMDSQGAPSSAYTHSPDAVDLAVVGPPAPTGSIQLPANEPIGDVPARRDYASFGEDVKAIRWEFAAVAGYYTAINAAKLFKNPRLPRTKKEGWFGRSTNNVGVDKLAHAYSSYVISEILVARLRKKTGGAPGSEVTAAILASGVMAWAEFFDSIEPSGGWSWEDVAFNSLGAGFSALRNSVPGLDKKLDFRLMIEPNKDIYAINGKEHFQQQRYLFALKAAGFRRFEHTPLRLVEFHLGYRGDDFLNEDREAGITPKRHIFVGLGLNLRELLFKRPSSRAGRAAGEVLDYFQPPYTAVHTDLTE